MTPYAVIYQGRIRSLSKHSTDAQAQEWYSERTYAGTVLVTLLLEPNQDPRIGDRVEVVNGVATLL